MSDNNLKKTILITGASRGVGLAIAKKFATESHNLIILAKTVAAHEKLPGTIWTAKEEILDSGANEVMAIPCDVRNLDDLKSAINNAGEHFGKIDIVINNASSIYLEKIEKLTETHYNLMHEIIVRSSVFTIKYATPYLKKSSNPNIINIVPKPDLSEKWFTNHTVYTMCKFASSMLVMGAAAELKEHSIAVNAVWPASLLDTAAVRNLLGGMDAVNRSRSPKIMADAIHYLTSHIKNTTGQYYLDEELINLAGLDLASYSVVPNSNLITDLYVNKL